MSRQDILIFPFNGNGLEALDCLGTHFNFIGFIDDTPEKQGTHPAGFIVFDRKALTDFPGAIVLAVPGSPQNYASREKIIASLGISEDRFATVIHPSANISPRATIGKNVLIMAGTVICGNAVIGNHVCILPNSVIHHDSEVGTYTLVGSGVVLTGYSKTGICCYIGSKSSISNFVEIGNYSLIGIGSNVLNSVPENSIYAGNPARQILKK
ncbi:MAG: acetyltransferase [Crocinitomicaceae bacterium]|nr:acetyltransferase [Crocinitomicaceae bacterium]